MSQNPINRPRNRCNDSPRKSFHGILTIRVNFFLAHFYSFDAHLNYW